MIERKQREQIRREMPKVETSMPSKGHGHAHDHHHEEPGMPQDIEPVDIEKLKFD